MKKLILIFITFFSITGVGALSNYEDYFDLVKLNPYILLSKPIPTYYSNEPNICGIIAAKDVLEYYGINKTTEDIKKGTLYHRYDGVKFAHLKNYFNDLGLNAYLLQGYEEEVAYQKLKDYVSQDIPVVVFQKSSDPAYSRHISVIVGFEFDEYTNQSLIITTDQLGLRFIEKTEFLDLWKVGEVQNKMIVVEK